MIVFSYKVKIDRNLKSFVQVKKKAFASKTAECIVQGQVGAGGFVEEDAEASSIAGLEYLKEFCPEFVVAGLEIAEDNTAEKFVGENGEAEFEFGIVEFSAFEVLRLVASSAAEGAVSGRAWQFEIGNISAEQV